MRRDALTSRSGHCSSAGARRGRLSPSTHRWRRSPPSSPRAPSGLSWPRSRTRPQRTAPPFRAAGRTHEDFARRRHAPRHRSPAKGRRRAKRGMFESSPVRQHTSFPSPETCGSTSLPEAGRHRAPLDHRQHGPPLQRAPAQPPPNGPRSRRAAHVLEAAAATYSSTTSSARWCAGTSCRFRAFSGSRGQPRTPPGSSSGDAASPPHSPARSWRPSRSAELDPGAPPASRCRCGRGARAARPASGSASRRSSQRASSPGSTRWTTSWSQSARIAARCRLAVGTDPGCVWM